jgi:two-component system response regulator YesN
MQDINIRTIAADVYLSPNYLGSIFKKCTGSSLNDYLCRYRLEKAREMLLLPTNKVSCVARAVGIPNVSYFCTLFKDMFGIAPGEYQEINSRSGAK